MKKLILIVAFMIITCATIYAWDSKPWGMDSWGVERWGVGSWDSGDVSPPPEAGFLLLETSGDKLLLETGVTDALLLEG